MQRLFLGLRERGGVGCVAILALVLLLLDLEDIRRAAIADEQVCAVVGFEERLQRLDAPHEADQIVLIAEREHGIDQIVANAFLAQRDFKPVGKEVSIEVLAATSVSKHTPDLLVTPTNTICRVTLTR